MSKTADKPGRTMQEILQFFEEEPPCMSSLVQMSEVYPGAQYLALSELAEMQNHSGAVVVLASDGVLVIPFTTVEPEGGYEQFDLDKAYEIHSGSNRPLGPLVKLLGKLSDAETRIHDFISAVVQTHFT